MITKLLSIALCVLLVLITCAANSFAEPIIAEPLGPIENDGLHVTFLLLEAACKEAIIPEHCDGIPVVSLEAGALDDFPQVERLHIPASITFIAEGVFATHPNLMIVAEEGSYAWRYAKAHGLKLWLGEPAVVNVSYRSILDINSVYHTEEIPCERGKESVIAANTACIPAGHELVGSTSVAVTVDENGNASHQSVMFLYQKKVTVTPTPKPTVTPTPKPTATPTPRPTAVPTPTPVPAAQRIKPWSSDSKYEGRGTKFDRYYGVVSDLDDLLDDNINTQFGWLIEMSQYQGNQVQFSFSFNGEDITAIRIRNGNLKSQNDYYKFARLNTITLKIYYNGTWDTEIIHIPDTYSTEYYEHKMSRKYTNVERIEVMHDQEGRIAGSDRDRKYSCYITDIMFMGYP